MGYKMARGEDGRMSEYDKAVSIVLHDKKPTTMHIQRMLCIGYVKAHEYLKRMESDGIVGPHRGSKMREILCP